MPIVDNTSPNDVFLVFVSFFYYIISTSIILSLNQAVQETVKKKTDDDEDQKYPKIKVSAQAPAKWGVIKTTVDTVAKMKSKSSKNKNTTKKNTHDVLSVWLQERCVVLYEYA